MTAEPLEASNWDTGPGDEANPFDDDAAREVHEQENVEDLFATRVAREVEWLRIREAARAQHANEQAAHTPPIDAALLGEVLARPAPPAHRVEDLIPSEAGTLVVAQRKTGKTTFDLNLAYSLITGEDFLGRFGVRKIDGNVALLNYEVSDHQIARWAHDANINPNRLLLVNLRGRRNPLATEADQTKLSDLLRQHDIESVLVDPFGRAYTGQNQNDAGEVGAWLANLDRFARGAAGALDVILAAHAGWAGERTRGSTALEDWADSIITLTRGKDDGRDLRFMRAEGRDIDLDEDQLDFDPATRRLTLTGAGSRRAHAEAAEATAWIDDVVAFVKSNPGANKATIAKAFKVRPQTIRQATDLAVDRGLINRSKQGRSELHSVPMRPEGMRPDASDIQSPESQRESVSVPMRPDTSGHSQPNASHASIGTHGTGRIQTGTQTCSICNTPMSHNDGTGTHPTCQETTP